MAKPDSPVQITGCIVTYNNAQIIGDTIEQILRATAHLNFILYVVDNRSSDGTVELIQERFPQVRMIRSPKNLGFGKGHNLALPYLESDYHVIINPDIKLPEGAIEPLISYLERHAEVAMVTPKILNLDGTEQFLPKRRPRLRYLIGGRVGFLRKYREEYTRQHEQLDRPTEIDLCTGCFMLLRTSVFKQVGGFDPRYFMYFEDADLTREVQRFGKVIFNPEVSVYHAWEREDTRSLKLLWIHVLSMCRYIYKWHGTS
ncbi:MAG: glycosyltransferase family 2 protein [Christensenellales bacterium]|jgi:GT2 family glycosyltransferase